MNLGVIIGRFQIHALHDAHKRLLMQVHENHPNVLVLVGVAPLHGTTRDPLSYDLRAQMIRELFPNAITLPIHDMEDDRDWSVQVDTLISKNFPGAKATLYQGKDGFASHYHGRWEVVTFPTSWPIVNARDLRERIAAAPQYNEMFRAGIIYAIHNQFHTARPAVDIAVIRAGQILLGRKEGERRWRLPGGMVDINDPSYEFAARRELLEETGLTVEGPLPAIGSAKVPDWRMDKTNLACVTTLYVCKYFIGAPSGADDLKETSWFDVATVPLDQISTGHHVLIDMVRKYLEAQ